MNLPLNQNPLVENQDLPREKRVLLVSYHFPPVGGAGVQRPLKFVKFLREHGWAVSVLKASNPSVPVFDHSLCQEIPPETILVDAKTWEPDYQTKRNIGDAKAGTSGVTGILKGVARRVIRGAANLYLQPDPQVLWHPQAWKAACKLLREVPHQAVLATAPSYSNLLLALRLKQRFGIPMIADYRDEWDLSNKYLENSRHDWYSSWIQERQQTRVLRNVDALIATTPGSTQRLQLRAQAAGAHVPSYCIYNGFDPSDFPTYHAPRPQATDRFRIVYTGTLWNLTSIEPLIQAAERVHAELPDLLSRLELVIVGRKTPEQLTILERLRKTGAKLTLHDYVPHDEALKHMAQADALCLLLSDVPGAERVAPAKLFEYLAIGRPILGIVPQGDTAEIVRRFFPNNLFSPRNVNALADWLTRKLSTHPSPGIEVLMTPDHDDLAEFTRNNQAGQLAQVLNSVCGFASVASPVSYVSPELIAAR